MKTNTRSVTTTASVIAVAAALVASTVAGCHASAQMHAANAVSPEDKRAWQALQPGSRIVVFDPAGTCNAVIGADAAQLDKDPQPLSKQPWAGGAAVFQVTGSKVFEGSSNAPASITLGLASNTGERFVFRFVPDGSPACIWPHRPELDALLARVGTRVVFAPWIPSCTQIAAAGTSPDSQLLEADPGVELSLEALEIGASSPSLLTDWKWQEPVVPWFKAGRGTLHLRADTVASCFVAPGDPSAKPPAEALALTRTDRGRCTAAPNRGQEHLTCRTSLGVWEGTAGNRALDLRLVRRTLGTLNILGGRPVTGGRFARTVVAVKMGTPSQERERQLYRAMDEVFAKVLAGDDGMVRVAQPGDPSVTLVVSASVRDLVLGNLERKTVSATSQYEDHKESRPNPDKAKAQAEVENARVGLEAAREDFARRKEQERQDHQTCLNACSSQSDANMANACRTGCGIVSAVTAESDAKVIAARNRLTEAQSKLGQTPDTIEVPVMQDWKYDKTLYSRAISAVLDLEVEFKSGTVRSSQPLSDAVADEEVVADERHNVAGHAPDRDLIERPESLIPRIAEKIAEHLGQGLRAAINKEMQEAALRAFAESGGEAPRPEYRSVDAMAFHAVGRRLRKAVQRGLSTLQPGTPVPLPSAAVDLGPDDCILAVAVSEGDTSGSLSLTTVDRSHGDLRGKSFALVEACRDELGEASRVELGLQSPQGASVRWGLYKVSRNPSP